MIKEHNLIWVQCQAVIQFEEVLKPFSEVTQGNQVLGNPLILTEKDQLCCHFGKKKSELERLLQRSVLGCPNYRYCDSL